MSDKEKNRETEIPDSELDTIAGGITSARLNELAIPLFKKGFTASDVYTELVESGLMGEDEQVVDSKLRMNDYLNELMEQYMA
ncbi:MAG: hypothetical protein IJ092_12220 [Atopobiaceae bacterium]|nr:hypothetical protein [Atopobiaceae bacterium]MBR1830145.1 hypothetical protein [Atopobiaceae bacterium]